MRPGNGLFPCDRLVARVVAGLGAAGRWSHTHIRITQNNSIPNSKSVGKSRSCTISRSPSTIGETQRCYLFFTPENCPHNRGTPPDRALEQHGRNPQDFSLTQLRCLYVAETRDQAWNEVGPHLSYIFETALPLLKEAGDLPKDRAMREAPAVSDLRTVDPATPGGFPIIGTAEDCIRAIDTYRRETRVTDLALGMHLPGLAPEKIRQSMTIFAREVMPHFK